MKRIAIVFLVLTALTFVVLVGCTTQGATTAPAGGSAATSVSNDCTLVPTPSVDVGALINEKLQNHHDVERIMSANHTRAEWNNTLDRMIGYGANISDTEKQEIIDYLVCFHP
jgi:hypothetical protein